MTSRSGTRWSTGERAGTRSPPSRRRHPPDTRSLPFPSPAWVNCYAIEAEGGIVLIDCGCDWEPGRAALESGLAAVGLAGAEIHTLIVSHLHPDHVGMAGRVVEEHGCRFVMHRRAAARMDRYNDTVGFVERNRRIAEMHGAPAMPPPPAGSNERPSFMPPLQPPDVTVEDGDRIDLGGGRHPEVRTPRATNRPTSACVTRAPASSSPATTCCRGSPR